MDQADTTEFVIVALGASAGGLEALENFFIGMPVDAGFGFIVVQHLAPDHASVLASLLARRTSMLVEQAQDGIKVAPNRVYIIPPNATLTVRDGTLHVESPAAPRGYRMPIDSLFSSLAEDRAENAVCIILSGTGTDGTLGLRAIKEYGGMAMAQTLESAKYDAILRSAISTGLVDHVLPVEEMPAKLLEYATHLNLTGGDTVHEEIHGTQLSKIHGLLQRSAGHDFSQYKENTILRRVQRRMKALQVETVARYIEVLEQSDEADRLFKDLLIGVTQFFRDAEAFSAINEEVIPKLFEGKESNSQVRACVVGCASGEEAYSIAILLCEYAASLKNPPHIKVFATDIDEHGLELARKGRYPESIAAHVSVERLKRFFTKQDGAYQIKRELREICLFTNHSFIKDPPFSRLDLISCRSVVEERVMIYLGADLQQKTILVAGGYLFLGPSEGVSTYTDLFRTVDKRHHVFQKKETLRRHSTLFLTDAITPRRAGNRQPAAAGESTLSRQLEHIILRHYSPACVVVRENGDAIYFSGGVGSYLQPAVGTPDNNVVNMAREGLRIPLRTGLYKAVTSHKPVIIKAVSVAAHGGDSNVDLTVEPIAELPDANLYIVIFEESHPPASGAVAPPAFDATSEETIRHLEGELRTMQDHAQAMFEELETTNEELKSANEEYQSTNEELETSKEEVQSFNEELETINAELNRRVAELDNVNSDLLNLNSSTQIATIFLDAKLCIKSFTPAASEVFRLIAGDVGRPITDLATQFSDADLINDIQAVLRTLEPRQRILQGTHRERQYLTRILPYRTVRDVADGVVATFTDVTELKHAEQLIHDSRVYAESIVDTVREPLLVLDADLRIKSANESFYETFSADPNQTVDRIIYDLGDRHWDIPELRQLLNEILPEKKRMDDFIVEHDFPARGRTTLQLSAREIPQQNGNARLILLAIEDITERKQTEQRHLELQAKEHTLASEKALREKDAELARTARMLTIGELATSIAHEIYQPLAGVVTNAEAGLRWLAGDVPNVDEAKESLMLIVRDGNRASAIIRRIREFVKKEQSEVSPVDIREVIHETVSLAQSELRKNNISLSLELLSEIPAVRGDRVLLQQVILNLITNACEAMSSITERSRELLVSARVAPDGNVLVSVRDSGVGIEPEQLDKICNAFFTTKPMGMGMGLSISQSIIEAHGGRIWAEPNDSTGVTLQFSLPRDNENHL